jgi:hypothetical protein
MRIHPERIKGRGRAFAGFCARQSVNPSNIPADKDKSKLFQVIPGRKRRAIGRVAAAAEKG